jgi:hypothetical protein
MTVRETRGQNQIYGLSIFPVDPGHGRGDHRQRQMVDAESSDLYRLNILGRATLPDRRPSEYAQS